MSPSLQKNPHVNQNTDRAEDCSQLCSVRKVYGVCQFDYKVELLVHRKQRTPSTMRSSPDHQIHGKMQM